MMVQVGAYTRIRAHAYELERVMIMIINKNLIPGWSFLSDHLHVFNSMQDYPS